MPKSIKANFYFMEGAMINEPISFTDISTGKILTWFWDFGEGNYSSVRFPVHKFHKAGNYKVTLRVSNENEVDTIYKTITIIENNKPIIVNKQNTQTNKQNDQSIQINNNSNLSKFNDDFTKKNIGIDWKRTVLSLLSISVFIYGGIKGITGLTKLIPPVKNSAPHEYFSCNEHQSENVNANANVENKQSEYYSEWYLRNEYKQLKMYFPEKRVKGSCCFTSQEIREIDDAKLKYLIEEYPKVIIHGDIDNFTASKLSKANAKFVIKFERLDIQKKIKLVFASENNSRLKNHLLKKTSKQIKGSYFANNLNELNQILENKKSDETYVLIFDNINGELFNKRVNTFNIDEVFTCNSYNLDNNKFSASSTDYIYIKELLLSLKKVYSEEYQFFDDFVFKLSVEYNKKLKKNEKNNTLIIVGLSTTTIGVTVVIIKNK
jgi:PKD repeat protein